MKLKRIAIDGTAGAGKSTLGELLAERLGLLYLDTGAMYRAVAWLALSRHADIDNGHALADLAEQAEIVIARPHIKDGRQYSVFVNECDVTWDIRDPQVTCIVPSVARHPEVRSLLIAQQRAMAQREGVVMVGRDIGTVVLPDAELKIFLDAQPETRACRRYLELLKHQGEHGPTAGSMEEVLREILSRDEKDRSNMKPAADAWMIMTDHLSPLQLQEIVYRELMAQEAPEAITVYSVATPMNAAKSY